MSRRQAPFPLSRSTWPTSVPRAAPRRSTGVNFPTSWARRYPARFGRAAVLDLVTRPAVRVLADPDVRGRAHLDHILRPSIIVANHASHLDTPIILSCLPSTVRHRTVVAAAADYFFDRTWKGLLSAFALNAIPLERTKVNRRSAEQAAELIEAGWNLLVFPEGGRSSDGWGQPFHGGAAYLSIRTGAPVIPCFIQGTSAILPKGRSSVRRGPTTLLVDAPLLARVDEDARHFNERIEQAVARLGDEARTDWWQSRRDAVSQSTPSLRGPSSGPWRRAWSLSAPAAPGEAGQSAWENRSLGQPPAPFGSRH